MDATSQQPVVMQCMPVSLGVTYTVSAWIRRMTNHPATYVYRQATVLAPTDATTMELRLGQTLQGRVLFDDVRVLDRNLLVNPGFETCAPSGQDDIAPGWRCERGGLVIDDPAHVRGRSHTLALIGAAEFRQVSQTVPIQEGRSYRISGWVKRSTGLPEFRFDGAGQNRISLASTSPGVYRYVSGQATAPGRATKLTVRLRLDAGARDISYFDDFLIEEITQ